MLRLANDDFQELITKATVEEVDCATMQVLIDTGHKILDVRYEEEYEEEHIPDVLLIPLPVLRDRLDELDPAEKYIGHFY